MNLILNSGSWILHSRSKFLILGPSTLSTNPLHLQLRLPATLVSHAWVAHDSSSSQGNPADLLRCTWFSGGSGHLGVVPPVIGFASCISYFPGFLHSALAPGYTLGTLLIYSIRLPHFITLVYLLHLAFSDTQTGFSHLLLRCFGALSPPFWQLSHTWLVKARLSMLDEMTPPCGLLPS